MKLMREVLHEQMLSQVLQNMDDESFMHIYRQVAEIREKSRDALVQGAKKRAAAANAAQAGEPRERGYRGWEPVRKGDKWRGFA